MTRIFHTYLLRHIPAEIWPLVTAKAKGEGRSVQYVIIRCLRQYVHQEIYASGASDCDYLGLLRSGALVTQSEPCIAMSPASTGSQRSSAWPPKAPPPSLNSP